MNVKKFLLLLSEDERKKIRLKSIELNTSMSNIIRHLINNNITLESWVK